MSLHQFGAYTEFFSISHFLLRIMLSQQRRLNGLSGEKVAIAPDRGFGENGEGYMRIALVENEQRLRQAMRNISRFVRQKPIRKAKAVRKPD